MTDISLFDYSLPADLIAAAPSERRENSRLMCLNRKSGRIGHREAFASIVQLLDPGDLLVLNDARVFPARIDARRKTGGYVEILLVRPSENPESLPEPASTDEWVALLRSSGSPEPGESLVIAGDKSSVRIKEDLGGGYMKISFASPAAAAHAINAGRMPLPPYILKARRLRGLDENIPALDMCRYQTVYAKRNGAVAAPTAGLHFTGNLLDNIRERGVEIRTLTLMVGPGTFMPVRAGMIEDHRVEPEYYHISAETAGSVRAALKEGRRVVATGTTCVRVLEHLALTGGWKEHSGRTDLYIYPPFRFRVTGALITNFHLPKSSLLLLACAFAGRENVLAAYREAIEKKYKFYSYGDATFIY